MGGSDPPQHHHEEIRRRPDLANRRRRQSAGSLEDRGQGAGDPRDQGQRQQGHGRERGEEAGGEPAPAGRSGEPEALLDRQGDQGGRPEPRRQGQVEQGPPEHRGHRAQQDADQVDAGQGAPLAPPGQEREYGPGDHSEQHPAAGVERPRRQPDPGMAVEGVLEHQHGRLDQARQGTPSGAEQQAVEDSRPHLGGV
ncbi:MAG: hypothetical protein H8E31_11265 [Planctomycetes bacterium]|nr:hypothetical protein [Planctomycetota bacterium]